MERGDLTWHDMRCSAKHRIEARCCAVRYVKRFYDSDIDITILYYTVLYSVLLCSKHKLVLFQVQYEA